MVNEQPSADEDNREQQQRDAIEEEQQRLEDSLRKHITPEPGKATFQLSSEERKGFFDVSRPSFGFRIGSAESYTLLPRHLTEEQVPEDQPVWRIELHGLTGGITPLGFDIAGDVVIGRGRDDESDIQIDLDPFGGFDKGVSRRHAMLRPASSSLYLLDLGSTNGTLLNGLPVSQGMTRKVSDNTTITFGQLACTIKIIATPGDRETE